MKKYDSYTKEQLLKEVSIYKNRRQLHNENKTLFNYLKNNYLLNDVLPICYKTKWSYDKVYEVAKAFNTYIDFYTQEPYLCKLANNKGWINDFIWLSKSKNVNTKIKKYFIYAYIDEIKKYVYIGLSHTKRRFSEHKRKYRNSAVYEYFISLYNKIPEPIILENNLNVYDASDRETYWLNYYKDNGYNILNRMKTGSIGGLKYKWDKEKVLQIMNSCKNKTEFRNKYSSAFNFAKTNNLI